MYIPMYTCKKIKIKKTQKYISLICRYNYVYIQVGTDAWYLILQINKYISKCISITRALNKFVYMTLFVKTIYSKVATEN